MNDHKITASWDVLHRQASMSADTWLGSALATIRSELGTKHLSTDQVGLAIQLAAIAQRDYATSTMGVVMQGLCESLDAIAAAIEARP